MNRQQVHVLNCYQLNVQRLNCQLGRHNLYVKSESSTLYAKT